MKSVRERLRMSTSAVVTPAKPAPTTRTEVAWRDFLRGVMLASSPARCQRLSFDSTALRRVTRASGGGSSSSSSSPSSPSSSSSSAAAAAVPPL